MQMFGVSFITNNGDNFTINRNSTNSDPEGPILAFRLDTASDNLAILTRAEVVDLQATIDIVLGNSPAQW